MSFDYANATLTSYSLNPNGTVGAQRSVTFTGTRPIPAATGITPDTGGSDIISLTGQGGIAIGATGYRLGSTVGGAGGQSINQPFVVTTPSAADPNENQLAADAASGAVIPTLTLQVTNLQGQVLEKVTLTNATVVEVEQAGGGSTLAFDYQKMTVSNGSTTVTETGGVFAAPTLAAAPESVTAKTTLLLNVPGVTGPSTATASKGDFQPAGYQFTVGPGGTAGPLVVDLGTAENGLGVINLLGDELSGANLGTVTLDIQKTSGGKAVTDTITLNNAVVTSYTNPAGDVSVSFDYSSATLTSYNEDGIGGASTVTFTGTNSVPAPTGITPGVSAGNFVTLSAPGVDGFPISLSGYSVGSTAGSGGHTVNQPLVVTTDEFANPAENQLSLDAASGAKIPTLTLEVMPATGGGEVAETITLTNATVVEAEQAGGGSTFAFDYQSMATTTYQPGTGGAPATHTTVTETGGTFAAPTLTAPLESVDTKTSLSLNVSGITGPSTATASFGDFTPAGYGFNVGPNGTAGPLVVDLGTGAESLGVANLLGDDLSGTKIPTVTLDIQKTEAGNNVVTDSITLTNAVVTDYTNPSGDVTVSFDYATATVTSDDVNANGTAGTSHTVTFTGDVACYLRGTRIRTSTGDLAIENLRIGDWVMTAAGTLRAVRWLGWRNLDCRRYADPRVIWPIRIAAGALAENLPVRDLRVSPGHSIAVDGVLIQVDNLINGATVVQEPRPHVEYWHVELDSHDLVLAEGLAAESYLDTGNRGSFSNGGAFIEAFPDFRPKVWTETCIPLVTEGPVIERVRARLIDRAHALGFAISADTDAHVLADGVRIEPLQLTPTRLAFLLPAAAATLELKCRTFVPAEISANSNDHRALGLCIGRLQLDGEPVALDDASSFAEGWHELEQHADGDVQRWTRDRVPLPEGTRLVMLDVAGRSYYWEAPARDALALCG